MQRKISQCRVSGATTLGVIREQRFFSSWQDYKHVIHPAPFSVIFNNHFCQSLHWVQLSRCWQQGLQEPGLGEARAALCWLQPMCHRARLSAAAKQEHLWERGFEVGQKILHRQRRGGGRSGQQPPDHQVESRRRVRRCCRCHSWDSWQPQEESTPASRCFPTGTWTCGTPILGLSKRTTAHEEEPGWSRGRNSRAHNSCCGLATIPWEGGRGVRSEGVKYWEGRVVFYSFLPPFSPCNFNWQ